MSSVCDLLNLSIAVKVKLSEAITCCNYLKTQCAFDHLEMYLDIAGQMTNSTDTDETLHQWHLIQVCTDYSGLLLEYLGLI